jgi:hypothetical protein
LSEKPGVDQETVVGPSGTTFQLIPESTPPLERALANRDMTRTYLLDIIAATRASYPPEIFPVQLVQALGEALRTLPVSWLREYAYAGMLAILQGLEDVAAPSSAAPGDKRTDNEAVK